MKTSYLLTSLLVLSIAGTACMSEETDARDQVMDQIADQLADDGYDDEDIAFISQAISDQLPARGDRGDRVEESAARICSGGAASWFWLNEPGFHGAYSFTYSPTTSNPAQCTTSCNACGLGVENYQSTWVRLGGGTGLQYEACVCTSD